MSPANKFWIAIGIILLLFIGISCPGLLIAIILIWNFIALWRLTMCWNEEDVTKYKQSTLWKFSIFHAISLFNNFLNSKFGKNG